MTPTSQFALDLELCDLSTFDNFFIGSNAEALHQIQSCLQNQAEQCLFIWGAPHSGRSHLLQACCHQLSDQQQQTIYLPLEQHEQWSPDLLNGLEHCDLICLDNVDAIAGKQNWEEALFHLYNRAREKSTRIFCSAIMAPHHLPLSLADLQSRLSWGMTLKIHSLDDEQKKQALQFRAKRRGLELSCEGARFILNHISRDTAHLFSTLAILDRASLEHRRKLTLPFISQVLKKSNTI